MFIQASGGRFAVELKGTIGVSKMENTGEYKLSCMYDNGRTSILAVFDNEMEARQELNYILDRYDKGDRLYIINK